MLGNIQHLLVGLMTALTTAIMVILPINKLSSSPVLTPLAKHQQVNETPPGNVLDAEQEKRKENNSKPARIEITQTPTPMSTPIHIVTSALTPTPTPTPSPPPTLPSISTPSPTTVPTQTILIYTPPPNTPSLPQNKPDYSSYRFALQNTLDSLRSRLANVQASADSIPQSVNDDIAVIDMKIKAIRENEDIAVQRQTVTTANELGRRGVLASSALGQQTIAEAINPIIQQFEGMVKDLEYQKQDVKNAAIAKVYQFAAQDKDLSGKISMVEGLINKISSGSFTDSDIPLAIQATYY